MINKKPQIRAEKLEIKTIKTLANQQEKPFKYHNRKSLTKFQLKMQPYMPKNGLLPNFPHSHGRYSLAKKNYKLNLPKQKDTQSTHECNELPTLIEQHQSNINIRKKYSKYNYTLLQPVGKGTFGTVYKAKVNETGQQVAIKKVYVDKSYKNRQLQITSQLDHPNLIFLRHHYTISNTKDQQYLYMVMQLIPQTFISLIRKSRRKGQRINPLIVKTLSYQFFKGLAYLHSKDICHRDIKPHNILVNGKKTIICDFGSAKQLIPTEQNIAYICSRCYRAPQLILGRKTYTTAVDIWSAGCVLAQLYTGQTLFNASDNLSLFTAIINIMGTPTSSQLSSIAPKLKQIQIPFGKKKRLGQKIQYLLEKLLCYSPKGRISAKQALQHGYFDEVKKN